MDKTIEEKLHTVDFITFLAAHDHGISHERGGVRVWHVGDVSALDFFEPNYGTSDVDYLVDNSLSARTSAVEDY